MLLGDAKRAESHPPGPFSITRLQPLATDLFCGEVIERYQLSPGTVSHHLKILMEAGLVECRREGQFVHNRAIPETIREYTQALSRLARSPRK